MDGKWRTFTCSVSEVSDILNKHTGVQQVQVIPIDAKILLLFWSANNCMGCSETKIKNFELGKKYITGESRILLVTARAACPVCKLALGLLSEMAAQFGYELRHVDTMLEENLKMAHEFGLSYDFNYLLIEKFNILGGGNDDSLMKEAFGGKDPRDIDILDRKRIMQGYFKLKLHQIWGEHDAAANN